MIVQEYDSETPGMTINEIEQKQNKINTSIICLEIELSVKKEIHYSEESLPNCSEPRCKIEIFFVKNGPWDTPEFAYSSDLQEALI